MAEALGTALAVVGFLGQLFDGCVKAYGYFTKAMLFDAESAKMLCKVRIEEMRLVVWGREWGVAEGRFDQHLERRGGNAAQLRVLATQILEQLHGTVTDFARLRDKYGLIAEGEGEDQEEKSRLEMAKKKKKGGAEKSWRREVGLRTQWVIGDKDKFVALLKDLKDFNDGLEALFPPSRIPSFQRCWTHQLLERASSDVGELSALEKASWGVYPHLNSSANLKMLRINLNSVPQGDFRISYARKINREALEILDGEGGGGGGLEVQGGGGGGGGRSRARHDALGDVIIEWVDYDRDEVEERITHIRRMDDLAKLMHSASECHPDLHSIDCAGYTDDKARNRYGLVYKAPSSSFSTLHETISSPGLKTPDLHDRVALARTLALALWSLHSLDWLHKSLCSSNILFFPSTFSPPPPPPSENSSSSATSASAAAAAAAPSSSRPLVPNISNPYLSGFDASRPDLDAALSITPKKPSIAPLHHHPSFLLRSSSATQPFCKSFDIYSLGLVLLEIGLWKPLSSYHKPHYSPTRWRDKVVRGVLLPALGSKTGGMYQSAVEMCLVEGEGSATGEEGELLGRVVALLEGIQV